MFAQLTVSQKEVISLQGKNILKACPGSGKTFVVAHKVVHDFKLWKDKNKGMAILSFTSVAKRELEIKIQEISRNKTLPYPHFIGTLDAFISQFIFMPFGQSIMKCSSRPSIIESDFIERYSKFFWKQDCYNNGCNPNNFYIDTVGNVHDSKKNFNKCPFTKNQPCVNFKLATYSKGYASYKEALLVAIDILQEYSNIRKLIINRFPYIVVDEAQDTSAEQMKLLNLLFDNGVQDALLIGDPDQAIYEWRDADPSVFLNMYSSKKWNPKELNENFRCSQHICNATKIFSSLSETSIASGETKDSSIKPIIMKYKKENQDSLIHNYLDLCRIKNITISPERVAILVRGRSGLKGKDYSKINQLWQTPLTLLLAQATFYKGIQNVEKTVSIIEKILYYIIFDNQANVIDFRKIQQVYNIKEWRQLIFKLSVLLPESTIPLKNWKSEMNSVLDKFILENNIKCKNEVEIKVKRSVRDNNLKDFLYRSIEVFFADTYKKDYLSATIHAVKGCTFEAVMLIISTKGKLTSNMINKIAINTEEIRTFYVAATRAKKLFVLALPDTIKDKSLVRFPKEYWDYSS
jgi:superfamily I DNA/RNA helicase